MSPFKRRDLALALIGLSFSSMAIGEDPGSGGLSDSWVVKLGGPSSDVLYALDVDNAGLITVGGIFTDTIALGETRLDGRSRGQDGFVARLDGMGQVQWARGFGGDRRDTLTAIAASPDGSVTATGQYVDSAGFDASPDVAATSAGQSDIFVFRLAANGEPRWTTSLGGEYGDSGRALATGTNGTLYAAGQFQLDAKFGDAGSLTSRGSTDVAIVRLNDDGSVAWRRHFGGPGLDSVSGISADDTGVIATGSFHGTARTKGKSLTSQGSNDLFLARFGKEGDLDFMRRFGNEKADSPGFVAAAPRGSTIFAGGFQGTWELDGTSIEGAGATDIAVICWNDKGEVAWSRQLGGPNAETVDSVAVGPEGRIYIAGSFTDTTSIGGRKLESGDSDMVIVVLGADGELEGVHHYPSRGVERILAMKAYGDGEIIIGGIFQKRLELAGSSLEAQGKSDIFVARLKLD